MFFPVVHVSLSSFLSKSLSLFLCLLLGNLLTTSAVIPPVDMTPAVIKAAVDTHRGHIVRLLGPGFAAPASI
jgi:hypothetical protein